jgi:hypothetical protein
MNKAAELAARLNQVDVAEGMGLLEASYAEALHFDVIGDAMCVMHVDGSANIVEHAGKGVMTVEAISSENILKVLEHYRPFKELFKHQVQ